MSDLHDLSRQSASAWLARFPERFQRKISVGAYRPEIDGLRFFAIAFVIFGHSLERAARFFPSYQKVLGGSVLETYLQLAPFGVCLFFTISGFILANQAMKANVSPLSGAFLKSYFGRRIMRIEPPYILLLIATWLLISVTGYVPEGVHRFDVAPQSLNVSLLGSIFYVHDLVWGTFPRLFPPGWSLEVEVQFYLLAPFLFWMWARLVSVNYRAALAIAFLAIGVVFSVLDVDRVGPFYVEFSLLHSFNFFWLGIILARSKDWLSTRIGALPGPVSTALGWLGLSACLLLPPPIHPSALPECFRLLGVYLGLAAMFASNLAPSSGFRTFCAKPWISLIGGACYSIYLVHLQVIQVFSTLVVKIAPGLPLVGVIAAFCLAAMAVLAVGLTCYVQIERRFMVRNWHLALVEVWKTRRAGMTGYNSRLVPLGGVAVALGAIAVIVFLMGSAARQ